MLSVSALNPGFVGDVGWVLMVFGLCTDKCRDGYVPAADKGSCMAKIEADKPTAVWRVQL